MQHRIELTPLQAVAWRASKIVGFGAGKEVDRLRAQRDEIQNQIVSLYESANGVNGDVLNEIAREHGYDSIPGRAETQEQGDRVTFTWEEENEPARGADFLEDETSQESAPTSAVSSAS